MKKNSANKMWGGRFEQSPSEIMLEINQSISFDYQLYKQDIQGSIAHAKMLGEEKIISLAEAKKIILGLQKIEKEMQYPGQVKVTVIREMRSVAYAK